MNLIPEFVSYSPALLATFLAQQQGTGDPGGQGEDFGKSSPLGLLVLILFLIAVAFLVRSMTKHLKRVPASFDKAEPGSDGEISDPKAATGSLEADPAEISKPEIKPKQPVEKSETTTSNSAEV